MCVFILESGLEMDLIFMYWDFKFVKIFSSNYTILSSFFLFLSFLKNLLLSPLITFKLLYFLKSCYVYLYINTCAHEHHPLQTHLLIYSYILLILYIIFVFRSDYFGIGQRTSVLYTEKDCLFCYVTSLLTFNAFILSNIFKISLWFDAIQAILEKGTLISPLN